MSGDLSYKKYVNKEHALTTGAQTRVPSSPEKATTVCRARRQLPIPASSFPNKPSPKYTIVSQQVDQWVGAVGAQNEGPTRVECCEAALGAPSPGGASRGCACMHVCVCVHMCVHVHLSAAGPRGTNQVSPAGADELEGTPGRKTR